MTKMMNDMAIKPSGDIDRDFVAMMAPHHQGAIEMAISELRCGKNEQLRRIAQEIIVDQMQEIAAMNLAVGKPATDSAPAPTQQQPASTAVEHHHHSGMHMDMSAGTKNQVQNNDDVEDASPCEHDACDLKPLMGMPCPRCRFLARR